MSKQRKAIVKRLDKQFSLYIRARDTLKYNGICPLCHKAEIQCCFHWLPRTAYATRWREDNAIGACCGCNMLMEMAPAQFICWFIDHYGREKLDYLQALWHSVAKYSDSDLELMIGEYKQKLLDLKKE